MIKVTGSHEIFTPIGYVRADSLEIGGLVFSNGLELLDNREWLYNYYIVENHTRKQTAEFIGCCESLVYQSFKKFNIQKPLSDRPNRKPGHGVKGQFSDAGLEKLRGIHIGKNNPMYIHDRGKISLSAAYSESNRLIKRDVCSLCGSVDNLEIHHIDRNLRNNSEDNVMCLCSRCHHLYHKIGSLGVFSDKIVSIDILGEEPVFDVILENYPHNFVANGIVLHNCNYSSEKHGGGNIKFIEPSGWGSWSEYRRSLYESSFLNAEKMYNAIIEDGATPQEARAVLPNSVKTELIMTASDAEWKHFFNLRSKGTTGKPHPDMKKVADIALDLYEKKYSIKI